jgi:hypothetical protein
MIFLPYKKYDTSYPQFRRETILKDKLYFYPVVWSMAGKWYYQGWSYIGLQEVPTECASKEEAMTKLDYKLISRGHSLITEERAEKLKLLL